MMTMRRLQRLTLISIAAAAAGVISTLIADALGFRGIVLVTGGIAAIAIFGGIFLIALDFLLNAAGAMSAGLTHLPDLKRALQEMMRNRNP
jgi:sulfite exporter TauE/SafE